MSQGGVRNPVPNWTPRIWHSMRLGDLFLLLASGKFRISRSRWLMVLLLLPVALGNTLLGLAQTILYGRVIARTKITEPPLFIVGHFRSGTTHLYELLAQDSSFGFPTTYECFAANHFLITDGWLPRLLRALLPARRPMDNMAVGFDRPQEDEFALIGLGAPTLYRRLAFPNDPPPNLIQPDSASPEGHRLRSALLRFYRTLTVKKRKRLLLKSPLHTGRIAGLLEMFPDAQFVHIVRDPTKMFPSLAHTWAVLDQSQAFQEPHADLNYDELILDTFDTIYDRFRCDTMALAPETLCEVRYEDLLKNPIAELQAIYRQLKIKGFQQMRPAAENYLASLGNYQRNELEIDQATQSKITRHWRWYCQKYGYPFPGELQSPLLELNDQGSNDQ